jgi:hypothetical protein
MHKHVTLIASRNEDVDEEREKAIARAWSRACPTLRMMLLPQGNMWFALGGVLVNLVCSLVRDEANSIISDPCNLGWKTDINIPGYGFNIMDKRKNVLHLSAMLISKQYLSGTETSVYFIRKCSRGTKLWIRNSFRSSYTILEQDLTRLIQNRDARLYHPEERSLCVDFRSSYTILVYLFCSRTSTYLIAHVAEIVADRQIWQREIPLVLCSPPPPASSYLGRVARSRAVQALHQCLLLPFYA